MRKYVYSYKQQSSRTKNLKAKTTCKVLKILVLSLKKISRSSLLFFFSHYIFMCLFMCKKSNKLAQGLCRKVKVKNSDCRQKFENLSANKSMSNVSQSVQSHPK